MKCPTRNHFIGYDFVEALFKVMKQVDYISMPSQSNQQTMKKCLMIGKVSSNPPRNIKLIRKAFPESQKSQSITKKWANYLLFNQSNYQIKEENTLILPGTHLTLKVGKMAQSERETATSANCPFLWSLCNRSRF